MIPMQAAYVASKTSRTCPVVLVGVQKGSSADIWGTQTFISPTDLSLSSDMPCIGGDINGSYGNENTSRVIPE